MKRHQWNGRGETPLHRTFADNGDGDWASTVKKVNRVERVEMLFNPTRYMQVAKPRATEAQYDVKLLRGFRRRLNCVSNS